MADRLSQQGCVVVGLPTEDLVRETGVALIPLSTLPLQEELGPHTRSQQGVPFGHVSLLLALRKSIPRFREM